MQRRREAAAPTGSAATSSRASRVSVGLGHTGPMQTTAFFLVTAVSLGLSVVGILDTGLSVRRTGRRSRRATLFLAAGFVVLCVAIVVGVW